MHSLALPADDLLRIVADARRSLAVAWDLRTELLALAGDPGATGTRAPDGHDARVAVPEAFPNGALARAGLLCGGRLRVSVSLRRNLVFVTDPAGPDAIDAAPPHLLQLARQAWGVPDVLLDPGCGCGEGALSAEAPLRLMLDRDLRALAFADLNRLLNGIPESRTLIGLADLRMGLPRLALAALSGTVFCVAVLPPEPPDARDAEADARSMQQAALDAIAAARRTMPRSAMLRALIGISGVPRADHDGQSLAERAAAAFGADRVRWNVLEPAAAGWLDARSMADDRSYCTLAVELD
jgi:hypothetical protein